MKKKTTAPKRKVTAKKVVPKPMTKREFEKLPAATKRVLIARDILAQIRVKTLQPNAGRYIELLGEIDFEKMKDKDIRKNYDLVKDCHVCAIGAAIMSCTKFQNHLTFDDINGNIMDKSASKPKLQALLSFFDKQQLMMIEDAFEGVDKAQIRAVTEIFGGNRTEIRSEYPEGMEEKLNAFYFNYINDKDRLRAIMKNIIKNKGTFKP